MNAYDILARIDAAWRQRRLDLIRAANLALDENPAQRRWLETVHGKGVCRVSVRQPHDYAAYLPPQPGEAT